MREWVVIGCVSGCVVMYIVCYDSRVFIRTKLMPTNRTDTCQRVGCDMMCKRVGCDMMCSVRWCVLIVP